MRLSLQKAAHANMVGAAYRKFGYAGANLGHPSGTDEAVLMTENYSGEVLSLRPPLRRF
jgi:hypothetical protein